MKGKTIALVVIGGATLAFLLMNGHYVVRYVWLNAGQPLEEWTPLVPKFPEVRKVDWGSVTRPVWGRRLLMLQSYTPNIAEYAALSARLNGDYCNKKGYQFKAIVAGGPASPQRHPCWDKVYYITEEFKVPFTKGGKEPPDTWVFWIDSDAAIDDNSKFIEAIGNSDEKADLFICTSIPLSKNVNTGAMLLRMTPWMHQFLKAWWAWPNTRWHQTMCHEQSALDEMISKDYMGIVSKGKLALFGPTEFNSTYQHGLKMKGKFIQHYRGCSTQKRRDAFISIADKMKN